MDEEIKYSHTYDIFDILSEVIAGLLLIGQAILIFISLSSLPEIVPNHFNMDGLPNGYGSKYTLLGPFVFSVIIYLTLAAISRFPQAFRSPIQKSEITAKYKMTVKMIISLKPILMAVFLVIGFFMIQTAQLKLTDYLKYLVGAIFLLIFSHVIYWLMRYSKFK